MRVLLGMPCVKNIPYKTVMSLLKTVKKGAVEPMVVDGALVYDARDMIARFAVEKDYDYILFVDSDMVFDAECLNKLLEHDADIVTGLYITRRGEEKNVAYTHVITGRRWPKRDAKLIHDTKSTGYGEIAACGFGFCLIKTEVVKSMAKRYKSLFEPFKCVGEDIAFCLRARRCGYKIFIDRDVKLGHIGEMVYEK